MKALHDPVVSTSVQTEPSLPPSAGYRNQRSPRHENTTPQERTFYPYQPPHGLTISYTMTTRYIPRVEVVNLSTHSAQGRLQHSRLVGLPFTETLQTWIIAIVQQQNTRTAEAWALKQRPWSDRPAHTSRTRRATGAIPERCRSLVEPATTHRHFRMP